MATRELRIYRASENEYRAMPTPEGSVFYIARTEHGMTRRTRGWIIGTRINGEPIMLTSPQGEPLVRETLREAKETVRRMARFGASGSAAATYVGMIERGEGVNARLLMSAWLAGRLDVLGQFAHAAKKEREVAKFGYLVTVQTDSEDHAEQVMAERLGHDEDYGFDYTVTYSATSTE